MKLFYTSVLAIFFAGVSLIAQQKNNTDNPEPDDEYNDLAWRNIGPFRGGRSVAATGVVGQPGTYYMGGTGGGIFKTTNDGKSWKNISDGFFNTGTIGAIGLSESDPNIIYAGTGEHAARGVMTSMGEGMYKSTDAGKTWEHIGLEFTRHISDVIVHPDDPETVFVSAQGAQYGPSAERGIFKSVDGGKTWKKVLYVDENTGASGLSMDMTNPRILYAAMWDHRRYPWKMVSGGENSGLYKSVDGGDTWKRLEEGLPEEFGKAGISVSRANPERVYAVIEAEGEKGGVYRSDDAGEKWKQVNNERVNIARAWYYMEIFADPQNENIVYVLNAPVMKSIDGGKSFSNVPTPHGDNHDLWIHPENNKILINANDGGANISNDGGESWSTQKNQPTAQFYRVITDNQVPYNVYGGQQDNSAIAIASRTRNGGIDWKDWYSVAGCESAFLAFDPDDPSHVYGGCYQGIIEKWMKETHMSKPINQYPELGLSKEPKNAKYRHNWNAPIISSPHDRNTIYHAGNRVFKTTDGGISWEIVSPDLTRDEKDKQGPGGGPFTNEAAGGENYNTITYLVESPHEEGILYAGTDDGLIHITKDGGDSWENITPKNLQPGIVNSIEVSPHDPSTAYAVVMRYKSMDLKPYIFKTSNYGKSWSSIVDGINGDHTFVRVVREDKKKKGLLYAGTETGMYVSWNDGKEWVPFQLNLPVVPVNDLYIHDNDLVAATAGRSFWILDDLAPIQNKVQPEEEMAIFKPKDTYLFFGGNSSDPDMGKNPPMGVIVDYYLAEKPADSIPLKLEILQGDKLIRSLSSIASEDFSSWPGGPSKPLVLPAKKGYNRIAWDFGKEALPAVNKVFAFGSLDGSHVGPGTYTLRLSLEDKIKETRVTILPDPNMDASASDYTAQQEMLSGIEAILTEMHESVNKLRSVKSQLDNYRGLLKDREDAKALLEKGEELNQRITSWEENLIQAKQKTFQDVINFNNKLNAELLFLRGFIQGPYPELTEGSKARFEDLKKDWMVYKNERDNIINEEMEAYNKAYEDLKLPALIMEGK
ncbi:WD40/YVTN/BNR-like repeat-containing protein [Christiangramia crocea]|uniref:Glycosyl hydrolase n=1 Tax=Christiangramia crocea TaxID=2904124 RepID=A0A9X2A6W4_9FLAO|nr:glycosyl hydrolase [Gramella crocea]MCG9970922.1 glycosyl hydrolase [Gramella crocea]